MQHNRPYLTYTLIEGGCGEVGGHIQMSAPSYVGTGAETDSLVW